MFKKKTEGLIEMEKICEFCNLTRPIVHCQADSARLCLSCDSRVHSANDLFKKHFRTLLCEACGTQIASVNCLDHPLFMCSDCDRNLHDETTQQHKKRVMTGYLGCPSARDFAVLWGYDLNELKTNNCSSMVPNIVNLDIAREFQPSVHESLSTSELGSSNFHSKMVSRNQPLEDSRRYVLQEILNLEKLQHAERNNQSSRPCGQVRTAIFSGGNNISGAPGEILDHNLPYLQGFDFDHQQAGNMNHEIPEQYFPNPFSQLDNADPLSRSPAHSSQLWSQNMQDLGTCEEIESYLSYDGFGIPDFDLTFQNYEDLFGGDQEQTRFLFDDMGGDCSSTDKDVSRFDSGNGYARKEEVKSSSSTLA